MIKFTRSGNGLREYSSHVAYIDTDQTSKNYFKILDFPSRLFIGKNSFRISGNSDNLVKGSKIYIDMHDVNGDIIYHEILNIVNKDKSRTIVVYIYPDTPPGEITIYIAGRLSYEPRSNSKLVYSDNEFDGNSKQTPNVMWIGKSVAVTDKQNLSEIFFTSEPKIEYNEKLVSYNNISGSDKVRLVHYHNSTGSLFMQSNITPIQYSKTSKFETSYNDNNERVRVLPSVINNYGISSKSEQLPEYSKLTIIRSDIPIFTREMIGGMVYVNDISIDSHGEIALDNLKLNYSSSIIDMVNDKSILINTPFYDVHDYIDSAGVSRTSVFDKFEAEMNFTISYYDPSMDLEITDVSESYVIMDISNLEPVTGTVDKLKISYKSVGSFGEFVTVGEFKINEQNLLIDPTVYKMSVYNGLTEKNIGYIDDDADVIMYWSASGVGVTNVNMTHSNSNISDAFKITHSGSFSDDEFVVITQRDKLLTSFKGTEYKIKFSSYNTSDISSDVAYLDVYISGSGLTVDTMTRSDLPPPIDLNEFGTYVGTVSSHYGKSQISSIFFKTVDSKTISPVFVIRSGIWDLGRIEIMPRKEIGFSPNHVKLNIPLSEFKRNSELLLNIEYLNSDGISSNYDTNLIGVVFTGKSLDSYDTLRDKITFNSVGESRVFTSDGSVSGSTANKEFLFKVSGSDSRVDMISGSQFQRSATPLSGDMNGNIVEYSVSKDFGDISGSMDFEVGYPIFTRDINELYTTASLVGFAIEIETMLIGNNPFGVFGDPVYVWGSTHQNRVVFSSRFTPHHHFYTPTNIDSSTGGHLGSFGGGDSTNNYDSYYSLSTTVKLVDDDRYAITHQFVIPPGQTWNVKLMSTCKVIKFDMVDPL